MDEIDQLCELSYKTRLIGFVSCCSVGMIISLVVSMAELFLPYCIRKLNAGRSLITTFCCLCFVCTAVVFHDREPN
jgi:hypothetical protein